MKIGRQIVVFDAADLAAESSFWAGLLGGTVDADDDWHSVLVDGEWRLGVQLAPNHVPPDWPDGTPQQQLHLDLWVDDLQPHMRRRSRWARGSCNRPRTPRRPRSSRSTRIPPATRSACAGRPPTADLRQPSGLVRDQDQLPPSP
jgi:Glyoxalase-like domain